MKFGGVKDTRWRTQMTDLQKKILEIIDENSGGLKFLQLVGLLSSEDNLKFQFKDPDELMLSVKGIPGVSVITYDMIMSPDVIREKYFICRQSLNTSMNKNELIRQTLAQKKED